MRNSSPRFDVLVLKRALVAAVPVALLTAIGLHFASPGKPKVSRPKETVVAAPTSGVPSPAATYPKTQRPSELRAYVTAHAGDSDPKVQDLVGHARISLAYDSAQHKDWTQARETLLTAVHEYKGTHQMSGDFGGVTDQAKYQAAVCLVAAGKKEEAKAEFLRFLKEESLSPLCHAAYRRLVMLNDNKSTPELEDLLQKDITAQEKRSRFETSVCGPKCIEHLLRMPAFVSAFGGPAHGSDAATYKTIAPLCGTNDKGTTIEGMRKGLKALGYQALAYSLNRKDLEHAPVPAIMLESDHYMVIEELFAGKATLYDPRLDRTEERALAKDDSYTVDVILFRQMELSN